MFSPQESSIVENSKQTATVVPTVSTVLPIVKARSVPEYYEMPQITDDRFSNQRSWYKSLDVEVCKDYRAISCVTCVTPETPFRP